MTKSIIDVMIVQQSRSFACIFKDYVDDMDGYRVVDFAFDGQTACNYVRELKPDLLIVDVMLPKVDGFGVIEDLKDDEAFKDMKVILTSSIALDFVIDRLNRLPIDYFFVKPIMFKTFSERIYELFSSGKEKNQYYSKDIKVKRMMEQTVKHYLLKVGMPANVSGYNYLASVIMNATNGSIIYGNLTNKLYPVVAEKYNTTSSRVERSIRHAIELAWDRGAIETFDELFGYTISEHRGKPTNGEFIAMITDKVKTDLLNIE